MDYRQLLRPWALVVAFLFVSVAVVDFVDSVRTPAKSLPRLLTKGKVDFIPAAAAESATGGEVDGITVDPEAAAVTLRVSGQLVVSFTMDERIDALVLNYQFEGNGGRARIAVAHGPENDAGIKAAIELELSSEQERRGRIRFPLHGHEGDYVFSVDAGLDSPDGAILLTSMRLIEEE